MIGYIGRRVVQIIPLLIALTIIIFFVIQLPPGDFVTLRMMQLELAGLDIDDSEVLRMMQLYRLDKPLYQQYLLWVRDFFFKGYLGRSMQYDRSVNDVIGGRLATTIAMSLATLVFTWAVAIPIGIYSATHQYSVGDYLFTFIGFLGISVPGFFIALIIIYIAFTVTGTAITGLFSPDFVAAPWSQAKFVDLLKHIWLPIVVIGVSGTAALIRVTRGMMLDELQKQYVITARAKGVPERKLLFKYPIRLAVNPLISTIGWLLPAIISGEALVSIVLQLPTMGPLLLDAVLAQDMYVAGSFLLISSVLAIFGTLLSDVLLAWLDPRIRFGGVTEEG